MPKQTHQTTVSSISSTKIKKTNSRFLSPKEDFGFKHIYTKASHLDLLMHFLNSVFKGRKVITKVQLGKTEYKGDQKQDRRSVFDVYCTGNDGENFVVEMQKENRGFFKDRLMYYAALLIQEQGKSVDPKWNYELPEIYFVAILDFRFADMQSDQYIHEVRLTEINSNRAFYEKLGFIYIALPGFYKTEDELEMKTNGCSV